MTKAGSARAFGPSGTASTGVDGGSEPGRYSETAQNLQAAAPKPPLYHAPQRGIHRRTEL